MNEGSRVDKARFLVAPERGPYPHTDAGAQVRRIFHSLRGAASENFDEHFEAIFEVHGPVPTKGKMGTAPKRSGRCPSYQIALLQRHERGLEDVNVGLKTFLGAA